jgi:hypothetical protein
MFVNEVNMTLGRVHNVKEVDMTQRQQRRYDATSEDVTWRDVDGRVVMDWRRLRSDFMANPAKIFYCDMIWELYCS